MCKKAFSILVLLALVFVIPAYQTFAEEDSSSGDYYEMQKRIIDLEKQLYNVGELVKDLTFNVQENQALAEIVKEMSFQFKKSESDIHSIVNLQDRIESDVIPQVIAIQSTVASLGASLSEKLKALGVRVYDSESSIQQLSARIKANEDRNRALSGIEDTVRDLNERVYSLEKALAQGASTPTMDESVGISASVAALEDKVSMVSRQVQSLKGLKDETGALSVQLMDVDGKLQAISGLLADVTSSMSSLQSRITAAETAQANFATFDEVGELQSQLSTLNGELQKARSASSTNFLVGLLGVLTGVGALSLLLLTP